MKHTPPPLSIASQAGALLTAISAAHAPEARGYTPRPNEVRKKAERRARAAELSAIAVRLMLSRTDIGIADCIKQEPGSTFHQWQWVLKALCDAGHAERQPRPSHNRPMRFRLTAAGRVVHQPSPGDH